MGECIKRSGLLRFLFGSSNIHNFKDIYEMEDYIPEQIIQSASRYNNSHSEACVLEQGTLTKKTYIKSYCTKCGLEIFRNTQNTTTSSCGQTTLTTYN